MRRDRSCTLNVSSLSRNVKEAHLREVFGLFGVIRSCELAIDKKAGIPKGYAYVEFDTQREAENARRHLHGGVLDGKTLRVELSSKTHERHQGKRDRTRSRSPQRYYS
ncbi:RNA recognition motif domain-containing protein, putative [Eimeria acervulina]|uniref:RNA recognition motif domain-containing protein, putative n=1 Tax=Eimeria acervulina TaxID=5801 RepID=U6GWE1_EIMAC|nr:RNA recognition motif domain-containing protein, putative [Eimeria acervulina]CDI83927.1 RNA recognition motif domain-containing protein, putative [Eimeria acervulina]